VKILITGHQGHIGHRAYNLLVQSHEVVGFDIRSGNDILNKQHLADKMSGVDVVVHLAGIPHPDNRPFEAYLYANVVGTANVAEAAHNAGVRRMIYASSTAYYGADINGKLEPDYLPIDEKHPIAVPGRSVGGIKHYPFSKVMAEQVLAYYGTNHMMQTVALRFGPANYKRQQYPGTPIDWRKVPYGDYRRGCMWANVNPDKAAEAIVLAAESPLEFWYEPFNIVDRYVPDGIDIFDFCDSEYPGKLKKKAVKSNADSLISPRKAMEVLGYVPDEAR